MKKWIALTLVLILVVDIMMVLSRDGDGLYITTLLGIYFASISADTNDNLKNED